MIDKSVKIVPGMRFSTGTQIRTVAKVVPGDPYPIAWDGDGDDADTEEWFRSNRTLVDQATPSDAAKQPERKVERRLAPGWRKWPHDWEPISRCSRCDAAPWAFANGARTACLACAESMGVYDGSGEPAEDAPSFARTTRDLPRITEKNMADLMNGTWREPCPCARMNLRDLSGDPVCYCTERPKEKARAVGRYVAAEMRMRDRYSLAANTGVAIGLYLERRDRTLTEFACEQAARRYPSTCDNEPSGA